jgi:hypothetical protein
MQHTPTSAMRTAMHTCAGMLRCSHLLLSQQLCNLTKASSEAGHIANSLHIHMARACALQGVNKDLAPACLHIRCQVAYQTDDQQYLVCYSVVKP